MTQLTEKTEIPLGLVPLIYPNGLLFPWLEKRETELVSLLWILVVCYYGYHSVLTFCENDGKHLKKLYEWVDPCHDMSGSLLKRGLIPGV